MKKNSRRKILKAAGMVAPVAWIPPVVKAQPVPAPGIMTLRCATENDCEVAECICGGSDDWDDCIAEYGLFWNPDDCSFFSCEGFC